MLFRALLASGPIGMRKVDGRRTPSQRPADPIDLAARDDTVTPPGTAPRRIPTQTATAPDQVAAHHTGSRFRRDLGTGGAELWVVAQ